MGIENTKTSHAGKGIASHEGGKALQQTRKASYNLNVETAKENSRMATQMIDSKPSLSLLEPRTLIDFGKGLSRLRKLDRPQLNDVFETITKDAESVLTLDQRIEAYRRWDMIGNPTDLEDMLRMQYERDAEDYSSPGTWYGCIRKWQGLNEEKALANFRTGWNSSRRLSKKALKAFYAFLKRNPLPPLSEQEKVDIYDRRVQPACLKSLFAKMAVEGFTPIFEETYEYSHSEPWTLCEDDYQEMIDNLRDVRADAVESFLIAATNYLEPTLELVQKQSTSNGLDKLTAKRRGFLVLSWDSDYDLLMNLRAMGDVEFCTLAESQGIPVNEALKGFYHKLQQWQPGTRPLPKTPDDCPMTDSQIAFLRSLSEEESECYQQWIELFVNLPRISEEASISNAQALTECLDWLCDEDLMQLKTALDKRFKPCRESTPVAFQI